MELPDRSLIQKSECLNNDLNNYQNHYSSTYNNYGEYAGVYIFVYVHEYASIFSQSEHNLLSLKTYRTALTASTSKHQ